MGCTKQTKTMGLDALMELLGADTPPCIGLFAILPPTIIREWQLKQYRRAIIPTPLSQLRANFAVRHTSESPHIKSAGRRSRALKNQLSNPLHSE